MKPVPIFDSLTHPSLDGKWIHSNHPGTNSIDDLLEEMEAAHISAAFAVAMATTGRYESIRYSQFVRAHSECLYPVAFWDMKGISKAEDIRSRLCFIKDLGYVGIKIHPRLSAIAFQHPLLPEIIALANEFELVVLLCTYLHGNQAVCTVNTIEALTTLLLKIRCEKIVLLHAGGVKLLEVIEVARAFPNVLLDLSLTLCKYEGSSLDLDLRYAFRLFDRRICIGSDYPEIRLKQLRERFEYFAEGISQEKQQNIAYKNLATHTKLSKFFQEH
jgi:predicted TIM-barrel fold metal-dependent hydrolase